MTATADPGYRALDAMDDFGPELRRLRIVAGLTLRSLAEQVAFDYSYLAQVERGVRSGSTKLAQQCDEALDAHGRLTALFVMATTPGPPATSLPHEPAGPASATSSPHHGAGPASRSSQSTA